MMPEGNLLQSGEPSAAPGLPATVELLVQGSDARIALDAAGRNHYGCRPQPDDGLLAFGSATASTISGAGFAAADGLRRKLLQSMREESPTLVYAREINRQRRELLALCGLSDGAVDCIFASSGTDVHRLASQLVAAGQAEPPLIVMTEAAETGSGVPAALIGAGAAEVASVPVRGADGTVRATAEVDAEIEALVAGAVTVGRRVLLVAVDVSKSGLLAPSTNCVLALRRRWADSLEVLVDACQFRLAPATLRAYLAQGMLVALTGSKFVGGPSFAGALLVPGSAACRLRWRTLPSPLIGGSCGADWPANWAAAEMLGAGTNFGLLLRWEAALEELRRLRTVPETEISGFLQVFAAAIAQRLAGDERFEPLPVPRIERGSLIDEPGWDCWPTIFPFLLYRRTDEGRKILSRDEMQAVYRLLQADLTGRVAGESAALRCQLGQPVACGQRDGVPVGALRVCASARLVVEAAQSAERAARILRHALSALDKAALIADTAGLVP